MPSAQEAREARRRKILARGSDRLAFIAGELPSISAPSLPSSIAQTSSGSDIPSTPIPRSGDAALFRLTDTSLSEKPQEFQELQEFASAEFEHRDTTRAIEDVDEDSRALQGGQEFTVSEEVSNLNVVSPQASNDVNLTCLDGELDQRGTSSTRGRWAAISLMTWDGIADSIDATENYRALGAVLVAVIGLILSYVDCTQLDARFCNWVLPWPVALVIVTDISLVFGATSLGLVRIPSVIKPAYVPEGSSVLDQLSKVTEFSTKLESFLKVGTVVFKTTRVLFLDCSIYAVTLISGYTLGQNWHS